MHLKNLCWLGLSAVVVILDHVTKIYFNNLLNLYESLPVTSFLNFTLAYNRGAAFSFLSDASGWQRPFFIILSSIISCVLVVWMVWLKRSEKMLVFALAMILGGALGNLWDRIAFGYVIDFIDFYYASYHFPAFNLADSAITLGVGLLIYDSLFDTEKDGK